MSSVVNEPSPLQKAIWFEHTHKKSYNFGQLHYTQEKKKKVSLKCVSYSTVLHMFYFNTFTSYVLLNCLEAAPLSQLHVSSTCIISSLYNCNSAQFSGKSVQIKAGIGYRLFNFQWVVYFEISS